MLRENKKKLILSSILVLLPILMGLLLWNRLPDTMATHWGGNGESNGFSSKAFAVFVPTLFIFLGHLVCCFTTMADPGNRFQSMKAIGLIFWIMPVLSWFINGIVYATALGREINANLLLPSMLGLMFIFLGNYLPKIKQNYTLGIKVTWALQNEANWNATHRFAGRLWFFGGFLLLCTIPLPTDVIMISCIVFIVILAFAPMLYSYLFYRRQMQGGTYVVTSVVPEKLGKYGKLLSVLLLIAALTFVSVLMFTGDIRVSFGASSFQLEAAYWPDLDVAYDEIDTVEFRETDHAGVRSNGFGSPRLSMGTFQNEEFGLYTRYTYGSCNSCVVLTSRDKVMVINGKTEEATREIYNHLMDNVNP